MKNEDEDEFKWNCLK